jgi:DNA-binding MarR family transcriptional regulator
MDDSSTPLAVGLVRLAAAIDLACRTGAAPDAHTVADQQLLLTLVQRDKPWRLTELASRTGMELKVILAELNRMADNGLVSLQPAPSYSPHEIAVSATEQARAIPPQTRNWAGLLLRELDGLADPQRERLLRVVVGRIAKLQREGRIPVTRMCVTCRFFQPYAHPGMPAPHHCALVDAPFGVGELRLRCPEQEPPRRLAS